MGSQAERLREEFEARSFCLLLVPPVIAHPYFLSPEQWFFLVAVLNGWQFSPHLRTSLTAPPLGHQHPTSGAPSSELRISHAESSSHHRLSIIPSPSPCPFVSALVVSSCCCLCDSFVSFTAFYLPSQFYTQLTVLL